MENDDPTVVNGQTIEDDKEDEGRIVERTVFVNAANWPMGDRTIRGGVVVDEFGGPGFQAVVVDLKA